MCKILTWIGLVFWAATGLVHAAHTEAELLLAADTAKAGDTVLAGVRLKMEPGWHTYWKNPGDAGQATEIKWSLPAGVSAGEIQWPLPKKLPPLEVTTYGYEDEVILLVPLTLASNLPAGSLNLAAKVSWLECKDSCIPAGEDVQASLNIGPDNKSSADAAAIFSWEAKVPATSVPDGGLSYAWWEKAADGDTRPLIIETVSTADAGRSAPTNGADFFPDASDNYEVQPATEIISTGNGRIELRKLVKKFSGDWPEKISGVVVAGKTDDQGFEFSAAVGTAAPDSAAASTPPAAGEGLPPTLPLLLFYAFIGGLILNIMPCVLPVIALKILGFVSEAQSSPRRVRALGVVYAIGVLFSFLVLAAVVIGVKAAGHQAGWGMQFGNPIFLVCLTTLVTLVALNLFGVFEVTLGGGALDKAGALASRHGAAGAFFNGMLATALATPCTAPVLGYALGFAFGQSPATIILIFLAVGLGLSAPYLVLSWNPAWLGFLPKPGLWMEKFKIAMGFPVLATVIWLFTLASGILDKSRWLWFGLFLAALALAAWIWGEFVQRGTKHRLAGMLASVLLAAGFGGYAYWQPPDQIIWQPWSPEAVAMARDNGHPVLVDFTADWCTTCRLNKATSIEIDSVRAKLSKINAVTLIADYTRVPENISMELQHFNRAGVPLVLVYPKNSDSQPIELPEVLTPGIVLDALDRAAK